MCIRDRWTNEAGQEKRWDSEWYLAVEYIRAGIAKGELAVHGDRLLKDDAFQWASGNSFSLPPECSLVQDAPVQADEEPILSGTSIEIIRVLYKERAISQGSKMSSRKICDEFPQSKCPAVDDIKNEYRPMKKLGLIETFSNGKAGGVCLSELGIKWARKWFPDANVPTL